MFWFKEEEPEPEFWQVVMDWLSQSLTTNYTCILIILVIIGQLIVERFARKLMSKSDKTSTNNFDVPIKSGQSDMFVRITDCDNQQNGNACICCRNRDLNSFNGSQYNNNNCDNATTFNKNEVVSKLVKPSNNVKMATNDKVSRFNENETRSKRVNPSTNERMATENEDKKMYSTIDNDTYQSVDGIISIKSDTAIEDDIDLAVTIDEKEVKECNPIIESTEEKLVDFNNRKHIENIWTKMENNSEYLHNFKSKLKIFDPGGPDFLTI